MTSFRRSLFFAAAAICSASLLPSAQAQTSLSTGDGFLKVSSQMPEEVRLGESFNYTVEVTNISDAVTLHQVKLAQKSAEGLTIESVSQSGKQQNEKKSQSEDKQKKNNNSKNQMVIQMLKPGESRKFDVEAVADKEGEIRSCLEVVSYKPAICLTSEAVKPKLELTKFAPKEANRCNVIEVEYTLKNGGSGDVGPITITDSLGDGLATIDGEKELKFNVDGLKAGDTRKFLARVYASKSGEFGSRAVAKADESELSSRSQKTQTKVVSADLVANVNGPNRLYGNDLAHFTATITNQGNAPAEDVRINLMWPAAANLADLSEPQLKSGDQSQQSNSKKQSEGQPTVAKSDSQSGSNSENGKNSEQSQQDNSPKMAEEMLTIEKLNPGQSATIDYAIRTGELDEIPTKVKATSVCTVDPAKSEENATTRATATAMARAKVVRLPALQLTVVDDEDPVKDGSEVIYTIKVWNEGDAIDNNVRLTAELADGLKFVSADGPTELKEDGQSIQFAPIKKMQPGDEVTYTVKAEGDGEGSVRLTTQLASQSLSSKITAEEPTRIFKR
ncbi:COG1361 family protein [Rhodopirellula islandica]|nr:DUF11 domain-containing protein [Rhodopirellula islandica]